jgi:hypothetical protein
MTEHRRILAAQYQFSTRRVRAFARESYDIATKALAMIAAKG